MLRASRHFGALRARPAPGWRSHINVPDRGFTNPKIKKVVDPKVGATLVTCEPIQKSEVVVKIDLAIGDGRLVDRGDMYSVQVDESKHLDTMKVAEEKGGVARYLCHQEDPTLLVTIDECLIFRAARELAAGEEVGVHYCTMEWSMASPFQCAHEGLQVRGFAHLPPEAQEALSSRGWLLPHIPRLAAKVKEPRRALDSE
mmetsp:Transcript_56037/g.125026  ORF Transcript_56037/g.125026 Transcript_56037/m.125026 type:complete len:200 (-) Transcript_56037:64-663(-)